jgi:hypothetical protein
MPCKDVLWVEIYYQGSWGYETRPLTEVMPHTPLNPRNADYEAVVDRFF